MGKNDVCHKDSQIQQGTDRERTVGEVANVVVHSRVQLEYARKESREEYLVDRVNVGIRDWGKISQVRA